jgi:hypothetical protein
MNLKNIGKVLTNRSVGTVPTSYEKRIYRAAVSQRLRNTGLYGTERRTVNGRRINDTIQAAISYPFFARLWLLPSVRYGT